MLCCAVQFMVCFDVAEGRRAGQLGVVDGMVQGDADAASVGTGEGAGHSCGYLQVFKRHFFQSAVFCCAVQLPVG
jgi:hypothetical protein